MESIPHCDTIFFFTLRKQQAFEEVNTFEFHHQIPQTFINFRIILATYFGT